MRRKLTEKEAFGHLDYHAFRLRQLYIEKPALVEEIAIYLPYDIHINKKKSLDYNYMTSSLKNRCAEMERLEFEGFSYLKEISNPNLYHLALKKVIAFHDNNDFNKSCDYFQQILVNGKMQGAQSLLYTHKYNLDENSFFNLTCFMDSLGKVGDTVYGILSYFEPGHKAWQNFQELTAQEQLIFKLLAKGINNNGIGEILFISIDTVKTHRKNLYRKLGLNSISEIIKFGQLLDMVD